MPSSSEYPIDTIRYVRFSEVRPAPRVRRAPTITYDRPKPETLERRRRKAKAARRARKVSRRAR